jgi:hypothetical protein
VADRRAGVADQSAQEDCATYTICVREGASEQAQSSWMRIEYITAAVGQASKLLQTVHASALWSIWQDAIYWF